MARRKAESGEIWARLGIVCAILSILFLPLVFMILGIVFGCVAIWKGSMGKGIVAIILSIVFGIIGMFIGILVWLFV